MKIFDKIPFLNKNHIKVPNVSMYEMVRRCSIKYPNLIAYSYYGTDCSYKSYIKKIDIAAKAFNNLGLKKDDIVSIIMPNTPEAIISVYALNKLGIVINMIHPLSSEEEIKNMLKLTKSKYVLIADIAYNKLKHIRKELKLKRVIFTPVNESMDIFMSIGYRLKTIGKVPYLLESDTIEYSAFIRNGKLHGKDVKDTGKGDDEAIILHSGGTSGVPKAVLLTNKNFNSVALGLLESVEDMGPGVSTLSIMPIFHGFGLACTFHAVNISGGRAIILPTVNAKKFDETILKYKPNSIGCVPSLLEGLPSSLKMKNADLSFLRCIVCGGDGISIKLCKNLNNFLYSHGSVATVRGAYGMTEATAGVSVLPKEKGKLGSIGFAIPDTTIKIINQETSKECGPNEIGEICISGPTLMKEYLNNEEETKNAFFKFEGKKYLHTGDAGYKDKEGYIFFKSRIKRMIVTSGYNVYPGQIEQIILEHPYVESCAVVGLPHPYKREVVKAYIVLKKDIVLNSEVKASIREHCEKNIASYALPYSYGYRKELPKTLIGKVAYTELIGDNDEGDD